MRPALFLPLLVLLAAPALSLAAEVIGRASDAGGQPLRAQEVQLGHLSTRTDAEGRFVFRNVAPGAYLLSCGGPSQAVTVRDGINPINCRR